MSPFPSPALASLPRSGYEMPIGGCLLGLRAMLLFRLCIEDRALCLPEGNVVGLSISER